MIKEDSHKQNNAQYVCEYVPAQIARDTISFQAAFQAASAYLIKL